MSDLLVVSVQMMGKDGGSVENGRWRVDIPAKAFGGNATVVLGVEHLNSPQCQLGIAPGSKNDFKVPVTLTVDCASFPSGKLQRCILYWYDPVTAMWCPVPGSSVDLMAKTVSAPLSHFSKYSVGPKGRRSGW
jgi:hypothetical protein